MNLHAERPSPFTVPEPQKTEPGTDSGCAADADPVQAAIAEANAELKRREMLEAEYQAKVQPIFDALSLAKQWPHELPADVDTRNAEFIRRASAVVRLLKDRGLTNELSGWRKPTEDARWKRQGAAVEAFLQTAAVHETKAGAMGRQLLSAVNPERETARAILKDFCDWLGRRVNDLYPSPSQLELAAAAAPDRWDEVPVSLTELADWLAWMQITGLQRHQSLLTETSTGKGVIQFAETWTRKLDLIRNHARRLAGTFDPPILPITVNDLRELLDALDTARKWCTEAIAAECETAKSRTADAPPIVETKDGTGTGGDDPDRERNPRPRRLLTGWHEITAALEMNHTDREKIKSLNDRFNGPIKNQGRGTQPMVDRVELIEWWNKLAIQAQEQTNRRDGERASVEAHHDYGRDGIAAPEIAGGVKKRRRQNH
jgi:hypothetical protein